MNQPISKRTSNTQMPTVEELLRMRGEVEAKRPVHPDNTNKTFVRFDAVTNLFTFLGQPTHWFEFKERQLELTDELIKQFEQSLNKIVGQLVNQPISEELRELLDGAYDYLAEEDKPTPVDLGMVFGGSTERALKAIELYNSGVVRDIIISGNRPIYDQTTATSEAEEYAKLLKEHGVPASKIIKEDKSVTVYDNVKSSLNLLDNLGVTFNSVAAITSPFAQRRASSSLKKYLASDIKIIRVNSAVADTLSKQHWAESDRGIRVVLNEYAKLAVGVYFGDV